MIRKLALQLVREQTYYGLRLWPIGNLDILKLLNKFSGNRPAYVRIADIDPIEGFHPPSFGAVGAWPIPGCGYGLVSDVKDCFTTPDDVEIGSYVDFLAYCPTAFDGAYNQLNECFRDFAYGAALSKWGGFWIYVHDGDDMHIFVLPEMLYVNGIIRHFFGVLEVQKTLDGEASIKDSLQNTAKGSALVVTYSDREMRILETESSIFGRHSAILS